MFKNKKLHPVSFSLVLTLGVFLLFQNCEEVEFSPATPQNLNSTLDSNDNTTNVADNFTNDQEESENTNESNTPPSPQVCEEGKHFGVWLDSNDDGSIEGEKFLGSIVPFKGTRTAVENYNYFSASAHPLIGPEPGSFNSHVFFYEGTDGLSLNFIFNVDNGGSKNNKVNWDIEVIGNNKADKVLISDDHGELNEVETTPDGKIYESRFEYWENTDGGAIGPFIGDNFFIKVKALSTGDIEIATFHSENSSNFSLNDKEHVSSFIIGFLEYKKCN
ncbi:MAG: hypothetical protein KDD40_06390 [Bdellovibrionales bacterium]|nr:hypothetical protein [Bdellovibrionales bacterium]